GSSSSALPTPCCASCASSTPPSAGSARCCWWQGATRRRCRSGWPCWNASRARWRPAWPTSASRRRCPPEASALTPPGQQPGRCDRLVRPRGAAQPPGGRRRTVDDTTRLIADYAASLSFDDLPAEVVQAATRCLVDSLACGIAAYDCTPAQIGRRLARGAVPERYPGRILGYGERSSAEAAAFVNSAMIRNLDWNDQYPGGHPSDCLGAFLAIAEAAGADGRRLTSTMVVAYELFIRLNDATQLRLKGWDQGLVVGVCTAAGVGHLLRLAPEQLGEAVAIVAVANVPMRNTRAGELGLWKGVATAYAARNGIFAALL